MIISIWNQVEEKNWEIIDLWDFEIPLDIQNQIKEYNNFIIKKQITSLNRGIKIMKEGISNENLKTIENRQKIMAANWCKKYNVSLFLIYFNYFIIKKIKLNFFLK